MGKNERAKEEERFLVVVVGFCAQLESVVCRETKRTPTQKSIATLNSLTDLRESVTFYIFTHKNSAKFVRSFRATHKPRRE